MQNRQEFIVSIILFVFLLSAGCQYNKCLDCGLPKERKPDPKLVKERETQLATARAQRLQSLREQLKLTPLFEKWHHKFIREKIRNLYVVQDVLFIETASKQVFAVDRHNGMPYWVYSIESQLDFPPAIQQDRIYFLSTGVLHILDKKTGAALVKTNLDFVPCSPMVVNDQFLYTGGWDNFVYALSIKNGEREWRYRIDGNVWGRPAVTEGSLFIAGTDEHIYAINAQSGVTLKSWAQSGRYATRGANVTEIVYAEKLPIIFVASRDYNVYSLSRVTGELRWKFESGGPVNHKMRLLKNGLYVISDREVEQDNVLYVLDSDTGEVKWQIDHGNQLWFVGQDYDWVLQKGKKLAAVNSKNGNVSEVFDLKSFDIMATNEQDNMGYLATNDGYVFAVEEK
jgi:outer membrane protein assembly factor BamB